MRSHDDGDDYERLKEELGDSTPDALMRLMAGMLREFGIDAFKPVEWHDRLLTVLGRKEGEPDHRAWMILRAAIDQNEEARGMVMEFSMNGLEDIGTAMRIFVNSDDHHFPPVESDYYDVE
jgi:hypothetical protein